MSILPIDSNNKLTFVLNIKTLPSDDPSDASDWCPQNIKKPAN